MELSSAPGNRRAEAGFTYIGILIGVAIVGLLLSMASRVWTLTEQRERETQLLWTGNAFRMAIASYFADGHQYPLSLEDLLLDNRSPVPRHYLRRLYPDPMTGQPDWTIIHSPDGVGIMGVASNSKSSPLKKKGFPEIDATFENAECYCSWQFDYVPRRWYQRSTPSTTTPPVKPITPGSPFNPTLPRPLNPGPTLDGAK